MEPARHRLPQSARGGRRRGVTQFPRPLPCARAAKHLSPAYFELVIVTGTVSISARDLRFSVLAAGLFAVNLAACAVLAGLTVLRAVRHPRLFFADMTDRRLGPGCFTAVAGSCILGTQIPLMTHSPAAATMFLTLGVTLWS